MPRQGLVLVIALPVAAADLLWKGFAATPSWAYHPRSPGWLVLSIGLVFAAFLVARVPSTLIPFAAGMMAGGVLGNALSATWNGLRVPDPIVATAGQAVIAFNLADVFTLIGIVWLTSALGRALVKHRHVLPSAGPPERL